MAKYELKGGLRVNLAHALSKLLPCPIHKRMPTRMTKDGFTRMCLAVQQGRQDNIPYQVEAELGEPENAICRRCAIGEAVRARTLNSEPPFINWISVNEEICIRKRYGNNSKFKKYHGYLEAVSYCYSIHS